MVCFTHATKQQAGNAKQISTIRKHKSATHKARGGSPRGAGKFGDGARGRGDGIGNLSLRRSSQPHAQICHLAAWCLHCGTRGIVLALQERLEGPSEQQDGHDGVRNRISMDFELILGPYFESFLGTEVSKFQFVFGIVRRPLLVPIC